MPQVRREQRQDRAGSERLDEGSGREHDNEPTRLRAGGLAGVRHCSSPTY
jgi:hypothetical protein